MQENKKQQFNATGILEIPYPPVPITTKQRKAWEEEQEYRDKVIKIKEKMNGKTK